MAEDKLEFDKEAIGKILVADTDCESCSEPSDSENYFEEKEEDQQQKQQEHQQKSKHRLQQAADYQPGDCLKERTHIFNLLSAHQKV
jgi:glycyl-tRNA synthetase alpha subunit